VAIPISWLKILRISRAMSALSTPIGQVWAQRLQTLQRYASSPRDLGTEQRTVHLVPAAGLEQMAGIRAGVALGTVLHGGVQYGEEGPVALLLEELAHTLQELVDQLLLLLLGLGPGNLQDVHIVQNTGVLLCS
jgi:hypothetical protein